MKTEKEVQSFYDDELRTLLIPLENYRISKISVVKRNFIIGLILFIPAFISVCFLKMFLAFVFIFTAFIYLGLSYQALQKLIGNLRKNFKYKFLPILLGFLFDNYEYIPNQRIAKEVFIKSKLFIEDITRVEGEDFMRFKIGETGIMFCEANLFKFSKRDNKFFHGIFICASFNKFFTSETIVLPKPTVSLFLNIVRGLFGGFQRIQLEDTVFNKNFIVFGKDQVESRYILTPGLMNRLLKYKFKTKKKISFSFIDNRMYCVIPNYINLFEPALFDSFLDFSFILKNYEPLKLYTDLVDDLNLNVRIWSKQ